MFTLRTYYNKYGKKPVSFPLVLLTVLVLLSLFGISGSSVGVYDSTIFPDDSAKNDTILNWPRPIRSDEWLVNTQFVVSQANSGFPRINDNIGEGQDMSLVLDVPYKDWSVIFKPLNLLFFVLPLNFAFALKWWLLGYLLVLSSYLLFLKLMPKKILLSALLSLSLFFTPMIQWWYQTITIAPIYTGLFILLLLIAIYESKNIRRTALLTASLVYLLAVFALILYPPFQIPVVLVVVFIYAGYLISHHNKNIAIIFKKQIPVIIAMLIALLIIGIFYLTRYEAIQTILNTSYPGGRTIYSGGFPIQHLVVNYLQPIIQLPSIIGNYKILPQTNQSEASFFVIPIFAVITIAILIIAKLFQYKKLNTILISTLLILSIFITRISVPFMDKIFNLIGLGVVPHNRLLLGIGLSSLILIAISIGVINKERLIFSKNQIWVAVLLTSLLATVGLAYSYAVMPDFMPNYIIAAILCIFSPIFIYLMLYKKFTLALTALLMFSILSTAIVNPLEFKVDEINEKEVAKYIKQVKATDPNSRWITNGQGPFTNYVQANGAKSLSGVYAYPQLNIWQNIPNADKNIYNRYAHVIFNISDSYKAASLTLKQADVFIVNISSCDPILKKYNVNYVLTTDRLTGDCISKEYSETSFNNKPVYVYSIF